MKEPIRIILEKPKEEPSSIGLIILKYFLTLLVVGLFFVFLNLPNKNFDAFGKIFLVFYIVMVLIALFIWGKQIKDFIDNRKHYGWNFKELIQEELMIELIIVAILFLLVAWIVGK